MKKVDIPVKGGIAGHGATAPLGTKGIVWAVNTFPFRDWGHILWRPRCLMGTENEDYATIFDPASYDFVDAACVQDGMMCLVASSSESKLVWWKPGSAPSELSWSFPTPENGVGSVAQAGTDCVVALEGDGIWVLDYDDSSESFTDRYKIGAGLVGFAGGGTGLTISANTTLCSISGTEPAYVFTSTVYCMAEENSSYQFSMKIGTAQATETYYADYITQQAGGANIWTPVTFTFNQPFTPPFDVQIVYTATTAGSTSTAATTGGKLYVEAASKVEMHHDWSVSWPGGKSLHMNIGGTMCPDGGVVGTNRGAVVGKYNGNFLQMADIGQWAFQDEVAMDGEIMGIKSTGGLMIVATKGAVFGVEGWSYQGVNVRKLYDYGIRKPREMFPIAEGVLLYLLGRPILITTQGIVDDSFPFLFEVDTDAYITYLARHNMAIISVEGYEKVCVWSATNKAAVWWRFDEISKAIPVGSCKDILVFDNGKAYYLGYEEDSSWPGYSIELAISSGEMGPSPYWALHKIAFDGPILNTDSSASATLDIACVSPYNMMVCSVNIPQLQVPSGFTLPPWLSVDGSGVLGPVPENDKGFIFLFPNYHGALDTTVVSTTESGTGLLPTGNSFIFGLQLDDKVTKHPGALLKGVSLYLEEVGAAIQ